MRKILVLVTLLALFGLVSCTDNLSYQDTSVQEGAPLNLTAYLESGYETKTGLVDNGSGGKSVVWRSGDAISLFFNSGSDGGDKFTTTASGPIATFSGSISAISGSLSSIGGKAWFWATYPYNASASCDGNSITTELPVSQVAYPDDVADNLLVTVGRSENLSIYFRNTCAVIGISVYNEGITKILFEGNADEAVAGGFAASFDGNDEIVISPNESSSKIVAITPASGTTFETGTRYYFAILAGAFNSGYKLTFLRNDGMAAVYTRNTSFTFDRKFYTMTNKDDGLAFYESGNVVFEDANFKAYCVANFDTDGDGEINIEEATEVLAINVRTDSIVSLKGIEYFTSLTSLACISTLNKGQLSSLDVSNNTKLTALYCLNNQLSSLDVSYNIALTELWCDDNQLSSLDVSHNTSLIDLSCDNNQLSSLDVSNNSSLTQLSCRNNQLSSLDVSHNTSLIDLSCDNNQLSSLDVSNNSSLTQLSCRNNQLSSLDVRNNNALKSLMCSGNRLTSLKVGNKIALISLNCGNNNLASIDVSNITMLTYLDCHSNQLSLLDVSHNTSLIDLYCKNNQLSSLDVRLNTSLTGLTCDDNQLSSLDVSQNTALTKLSCRNNQLSSLDVSQNTALTELYCRDNQLSSLDVSNNLFLTSLNCSSNPNLTEIWLKTGQIITSFYYDIDVATIMYKD